MEIEFSLSHDRMDIDTVWTFLCGAYWSTGIRREVVERAVRNSVVVGAFEVPTGRQVGFARAVTDRATFAWLCDVFVLEECRGRGVARRMVRELMAHPELQTLRRWCLATRDAQGVYGPLGFVNVPVDRWMERQMPRSGWADEGVPTRA